MDVDEPGRGTRDNGLRCSGYTALADLDPRIADAMLAALRDAGIAAYVAPTPAATGGAMEARLPDRPIDRLWVDGLQLTRAREIVEAERTDVAALPADAASRGVDADFDAAWQQVLASLQSSPDAPMPAWPDAAGGAGSEGAPESWDQTPLDDDPGSQDEHFVPPPPPPLPRLRRATLAALTSMAIGLLILGTNFDDGSFNYLAIAAILGGVASIIWHMRNGPPTDSGWDDGAVV